MISKPFHPNEHSKDDSSRELYLELGMSFLFLLMLIVYLYQQQWLDISFGNIMLLLSLLLASFGYMVMLNEKLEKSLKWLLSQLQLQHLARILVVPTLTILIEIISLLSGHATTEFENNLPFNTLLYLAYVLVPVITAELLIAKKSSLNQLMTFFLGLLIIIWGWWFIEFDWLPPIVSGIPLEEFIGLLAMGWSFLIILSHEMPRPISRYVQPDTFKIIGIWIGILLVIIVPAALYSKFITIGFNEYIINQDVLVAIVLSILLFLGIFFFTGFIEEVLFRGLIFQWTTNHLSSDELNQTIKKAALLALFGFVSALIFVTPHVGLADPITSGPYQGLPLPVIYTTISILYLLIGILLVFSIDDTELIVLIWSSMVFGWAHFEDWRYILFATIAGMGYCDTYRRTRNVLASATLHATVNFIWGMALAG